MIYLIIETVQYYSRDESKPVGYAATLEEAKAKAKHANENTVVCPAGEGLIHTVHYSIRELGETITPSLMVNWK